MLLKLGTRHLGFIVLFSLFMYIFEHPIIKSCRRESWQHQNMKKIFTIFQEGFPLGNAQMQSTYRPNGHGDGGGNGDGGVREGAHPHWTLSHSRARNIRDVPHPPLQPSFLSGLHRLWNRCNGTVPESCDSWWDPKSTKATISHCPTIYSQFISLLVQTKSQNSSWQSHPCKYPQVLALSPLLFAAGNTSPGWTPTSCLLGIVRTKLYRRKQTQTNGQA